MKKIRTKRGLLGTLMIAAILGTGCNTEQSVPEMYVDDNGKHRLPPLQRILRFQRQ